MQEQADINIPPIVEEVAKEAAQGAILKWISKVFRWLRKI